MGEADLDPGKRKRRAGRGEVLGQSCTAQFDHHDDDLTVTIRKR